MLRFRLGQAWKGEAALADGPHDAFRLQLAGVDLLERACEEPLAEVVPSLVQAAWLLAHGSESLAQVSLPRAGLELCFARRGADAVELLLLDMGRPAKVLRPALHLELNDVASATVSCSRALVNDLAAHAPRLLRTAAWVNVSKRLRTLEHGHLAEWQPSAGALSWEQFPARVSPLGFRLRDELGRLAAYRRGSLAPLTALLCPGEIVTSGGLHLPVLPFVWLFEATRRAADETWAVPGLGEVTAQAAYTLGLSFALAVKTFNSRLAHNPWLMALTEQCTTGLSNLRQVGSDAAPAAPKSKARSRKPTPIAKVGKLRRLGFAKRWEHDTGTAADGGTLLLGRSGPIVSSAFSAEAFDVEGRVLFRRVDTHGVAVNALGQVLCANAHRLALYQGSETSARWLRNHDGRPLGQALDAGGGQFLEATRTQGVIAHGLLTGRELWRLEPGRTLTGYPVVTPKRVYLATDSGAFFSVSRDQGDWVFRMRSPLPFAQRPLPVGKRLLCVLSQGERTALFSADAQSGAVKWTVETRLARPTEVCAHRGIAYLAGERDGSAWVLAIDANARISWEKPLPSLGRPRHAGLHKGGLWVSDDQGAAAGLVLTGQPQWLLGATHEGAHTDVRPISARGLLLLPAETLRALDPETGRLMAQLPLPATARAVLTDSRLNVYVLDERGLLTAYRVGAQLAVV
jgi:hypothetical protein